MILPLFFKKQQAMLFSCCFLFLFSFLSITSATAFIEDTLKALYFGAKIYIQLSCIQRVEK
ncbi:hypothetical protein LI82_12325 [Methanococcoides methylutens]|uniref:Uncharacterized protein n=1 Tax=Methanococcoides methylutens TaxID=2226 RepID=A0A099SZZ4_METMT|nr:hypothetical protein LI82_12325 [Methanococcoides methylutens]